jgi:hypothetical protein
LLPVILLCNFYPVHLLYRSVVTVRLLHRLLYVDALVGDVLLVVKLMDSWLGVSMSTDLLWAIFS